MLALTALTAIVLFGGLSYYASDGLLRQGANDQLSSVAESRSIRIEAGTSRLLSQVAVLAADLGIVECAERIRGGLRRTRRIDHATAAAHARSVLRRASGRADQLRGPRHHRHRRSPAHHRRWTVGAVPPRRARHRHRPVVVRGDHGSEQSVPEVDGRRDRSLRHLADLGQQRRRRRLHLREGHRSRYQPRQRRVRRLRTRPSLQRRPRACALRAWSVERLRDLPPRRR